MSHWRGALFACLLLFAQTLALLHGFEHGDDNADADHPAGHACALCLAVHGLDAPVPGAVAASSAGSAAPPRVAPSPHAAPALPFFARRARAPPAA